ncbi:MAG: ABC transporter ATP-binding protein [Ruminococcus sp.]|nr:ABC transporter ATP-binding protein [Ruminococcus sp.]MBQ3856261.1 ABC transporter ATP-binding protein [Ruminococcus sp.]HBB18847.1 ABC transporter [Ruminococcus sp.]
MSDFTNAIEIQGITKKYDGFTLDNISFNVPRGSIMGFVGQNGAGKTTTIRSILNIIPIDSGKISLLGMDHLKNEEEIKERIAVVFDEMPFHDLFTAKDMGRIFKGLYQKWSDQTFQQFMERFQLPMNKKLGKFSKGMKMKMQIACALSHEAELLIMDEATTGLDPVVRSEILDIFLEYLQDEDHSILMSSHITSDLEKIADSVTFIDKGRILLSGYKDEILDSHGILKCTKRDYKDLDPEDFISARLTDFGAEALVSDRAAVARKYSGAVIDPASLDEIMVYYVNKGKKEWS